MSLSFVYINWAVGVILVAKLWAPCLFWFLCPRLTSQVTTCYPYHNITSQFHLKRSSISCVCSVFNVSTNNKFIPAYQAGRDLERMSFRAAFPEGRRYSVASYRILQIIQWLSYLGFDQRYHQLCESFFIEALMFWLSSNLTVFPTKFHSFIYIPSHIFFHLYFFSVDLPHCDLDTGNFFNEIQSIL